MKKIFLIFYAALQTATTSAQDSLPVFKARFDKSYFNSFISDSKDIITAPFHWNQRQWLTAGAVTTVVAITLAADQEVNEIFLKNNQPSLDNLSKNVFRGWGGLYNASLLSAFYLEGIFNKNERSKKTAMTGAKALIITILFTQGTKYLVQRHRPFQDAPPDPFHIEGPLKGLTSYKSFFSGHSANAFAVATVLSMEYKEKKWIPYASYMLAAGTGLSRIYDQQHWASDVIAGAAVGYCIGRFVLIKSKRLSISPFSGNARGLQMHYAIN